MWQEAELYETHGLYEHAVLVYQTILTKDPDNRRAQAKIVQLEFSQKMEQSSANHSAFTQELTPRLALDLGLAYMGMGLYEEALEEFTKARRSPSPVSSGALRYSMICLTHLERFKEAGEILEGVLADEAVSQSEKGDIVSDIIEDMVEQGGSSDARKLLMDLPEALKIHVRSYDELVESLSSASTPEHLEVVVEDTQTGKTYVQPLLGHQEAADQEETTQKIVADLDSSFPLMTIADYSLDNKHWREGICSRLSAHWALLKLPEKLRVGDSLVLKIHVPTQSDGDPVWVVSRIAHVFSKDLNEDFPAVKAEFVSFLPGAETILKYFIDQVVRDPSILSETGRSDSLISSLGEHVAEVAEDASPVSPSLVDVTRAAAEIDEHGDLTKKRTSPSIRFSCQCGQVYSVPRRNVGRQGKCGNCGKIMSVPAVDLRPDPLADFLVGKTVGGCRLLYRIGGGGMGGVFKAHHVALDMPVAVKILHGHLAERDPVFIKRFIREARAAAQLQHPNIVGVLNVGFENGLHYLVMSYVGGGSAAVMLAREGRLSVEKVLRVAIEVARALVLAEENSILHRDIKPANILFTEKGEAKLADLGLARHYMEAQDSGITQTGIACGTPLYFSPEQAKGAKDLDIRSDIYSLGITLYHLLNGSPPFKGDSAYVIFQKHVNEPLPPFDDFTPPVPESVFKMIHKMTEKDPLARYQNAQELIVTLELITHEMANARKPPAPTTQKRSLLERLGLKKPS
jgi:hypothetical protein